MKRPFHVNVAPIRGVPGSRQSVEVFGPLDHLQTIGASVPSDAKVSFTGVLEAIEGSSIVATGAVRAPWVGECRRCLNEARGSVEVKVREVFEAQSTEGETYSLEGDKVDLEPMTREAVMLDLPLAPLCRSDCAGLCPECGADRNEVSCQCTTDLGDPRWAALDVLKEDG